MAEALVTALVSTAVSTAVNYLLAPDGPDVEGPRLEDRGVQRNSYGTALSLVYGRTIVTGTLTWMLNNELTETKTTETQGGKGGGGGQKVTTYAYSMTGTNAVCLGPINGIERVWADTTLVYDVNSDSFLDGDSAYQFDFLLGANTQSPGADESGEKGAASTPAYRGTALHVIDDMELADFGNRVPNFQYEVAGLFSYDLDAGTTDISITKLGDLVGSYTFNNGWGFKLGGGGTGLRYAFPKPQINTLEAFTGTNRTTTALAGGLPFEQFFYSNSGGAIGEYIDAGQVVEQVTFPRNGNRYALIQLSGAMMWYDTLLSQAMHDPIDSSVGASRVGGVFDDTLSRRTFNYSFTVAETENYLWALDFDDSFPQANDNIYLCAYQKLGGSPFPAKVWNLTNLLPNATEVVHNVQLDGTYDQRMVVAWEGSQADSKENGIVFTEANVFGGSPVAVKVNSDSGVPGFLRYNSRKNWVLGANNTQVYLFDATTGETLWNTSWSVIDGVSGSNRQVTIAWTSQTTFTDGFSIFQVAENPNEDSSATTDSPGADLQSVVEDLCYRAGLQASEVDATGLSGTRVRGYSINAVQSLRESLEPLMLAYHFEPFEEDYKLKFAFKDKASSLTLTEDDMRPHLMGTDGGQFIEVEQIEESKLPRRININYLNFNADYEPDTQFSERSADATKSRHTSEVNLQMTLTPTEAVRMSEVLLREAWIGRFSRKYGLPKKYSYLSPTDVVTLDTDDYTVDVRIQSLALGVDGRMEIEAVDHNQAVYTSTKETDEPANTSQGLKNPNAEVIFSLINTNSLDYSTGVPDGFFPMYLAGWSTNFRAYQLQESPDRQTWTDIGEAQVQKATMGSVTSVAGAPKDHFLNNVDPVETIDVRFFEAPDLSNVTDVQVLNGQNIFALGKEGRWEILGAATITQVDTYNYTLSRLFRGLKGTEGNVGTMEEGDVVVLLNPQTVGQVPIAADKVGTTMYYRALYGENTPDSEFDKTIVHLGNPLKEYAPSNITGRRNSSNDLVITWTRRTRVSGEWRDNVDAFLAANSRPEEYKVVIKNGSTTLRTITGITSQTTTYTAAQQTTDSAPSTVTVEVTQVSSDGDGYTGTATL